MRKILFGLMVLLAAPALAQMPVTGGSNIALSEYPGPACSKPPVAEGPPAQPRNITDRDQVDAFNAAIRKYNRAIADHNAAMTAFNECMRVYVQNGNSDMTRIKQKLDEAIAAANAH